MIKHGNMLAQKICQKQQKTSSDWPSLSHLEHQGEHQADIWNCRPCLHHAEAQQVVVDGLQHVTHPKGHTHARVGIKALPPWQLAACEICCFFAKNPPHLACSCRKICTCRWVRNSTASRSSFSLPSMLDSPP